MFLSFVKTLRSARQPLSSLGKASAVSLLALAVLCGLISVFSSALLVIAIAVFVSLILVLSGLRWAPAAGSALAIYVLYVFLIQVAYPMYHLAHPKDALSSPVISFVLFVIMLLIIWWALLAVGAGLSATWQNYQSGERARPRWFTASLTGMLGVLLGALLIGALAQPATASATSTTNGVPTVHMGISSFSQSSITLTKGSKLVLMDDGNFAHVLANGTWVHGQPQKEELMGEPSLNNLVVSSGTITVGPFATAGTYHIYCTIHSGMMLTVIVQ